MTMGRQIVVLFAAVVWPAVAGAVQPQVTWGNASYVSRYGVSLQAGTTYTIEVDPLDPAEDTVLHLWYVGDGVEVAQDDDGGQGLASKIVYTVPAGKGGTYYVITRAYSWTASGYCTVRVKVGQTQYWAWYTRFAGDLILISGLSAAMDVHTVIARDQANDTFAYYMRRNSALGGPLKIVKMDDDSGVEYAASVTVPFDYLCWLIPSYCYHAVLLGTYS